jgi:glycosyltransferase involved in cell wall biosynthesis
MRVLHAIHDFLPRHRAGSEIYAFDLCRALSMDHLITVVCAEFDPARSHGEVAWRMYEGLPVVELVNNWDCASFAETYSPPIIGEQLRHIFHAVQPDVVHVHNLLNLSFDLTSIARAAGIPVVATLHDYTLVCPSGGQRIHMADAHVCRDIDETRCARCFTESAIYQHSAYMRLTRALPAQHTLREVAKTVAGRFPSLTASIIRAGRSTSSFAVTADQIAARLAAARRVIGEVDLFVAPSASIADEFIRFGVSPDRMVVADYGFAPLHPAGRSAGPRLQIGFVGTIVWHKGLHVLIDALQPLPNDSYELHVFGDLNTFPLYSADIRRRAAAVPTTFHDPFNREHAADAYAAIDLLVVPSLWMENSPLVIHEAFMAGVPVIAARIGGIPGLIADGVNGLLYDPADPAQLTAALRRLIDHRDLLAKLANAAPAVKSIADDAAEWSARYAAVIARAAALPSAS